MANADKPAVPQRVWEWVVRLHALTAGNSSAEEAKARVEMVAPMLARSFPIEAFCQRSLEHVAAQMRFWPAYGEITAALNGYRVRYMPDTTLRLTSRPNADLPPDRGPRTPEELAYVEARMAEARAHLAAAAAVNATVAGTDKPLPDVSLKGEHLERVRAERRARFVG